MKPLAKTLLLVLLVVVLLLGGGCIYLAVRAYRAFIEPPTRAEKPLLYVKTQPLDLQPCHAKPETDLSYFGYSVGVPWAEIAESRGDYYFGTSVTFTSGHKLSFRLSREGIDEPMDENTQENRRRIEEILGPEAAESNFGFFKALFDATPDDLGRASWRNAWIVRTILLRKEQELYSEEMTPIYAFETTHVRGFQFGDSTRQESVALWVFDPEDRRLLMSVTAPEQPPAHVSREELSCILQNIRPVEEPRE